MALERMAEAAVRASSAQRGSGSRERAASTLLTGVLFPFTSAHDLSS